MTALSSLPSQDARQACLALAKATVWPAEEWAIATHRLLDGAMPMTSMGLEMLIKLTLATKAPPSEIANRMVEEYTKAATQGLQSL